ncbi:hypothetical protein BDR26DRAFT_891705 [Obelidium mucronatum]|nr:hypothetical protein BDR26DRAFT_891705 [Obelidium mucronatum]
MSSLFHLSNAAAFLHVPQPSIDAASSPESQCSQDSSLPGARGSLADRPESSLGGTGALGLGTPGQRQAAFSPVSPADHSVSAASSDGGKQRAKAGRKLTTTDPASKRIAQTRAAQRAFRERKAAQFEGLQQRVAELELLLSVSQEESAGLRIQNTHMRDKLSKCACTKEEPSYSSASSKAEAAAAPVLVPSLSQAEGDVSSVEPPNFPGTRFWNTCL